MVHVADEALRAEVAAAAPASRNIQLIQERRIGPSADDPLGAVDTAGADLQARVPPAVRDLFRDRVFTVDTPRWRVTSAIPVESLATLRFQQDVEDHVRVIEGRLPTGVTTRVVDPGPGPNPTAPRIVYEGAISTDTARQTGVKVGDELSLALDATDPLARGRFDRAAVRIVGTFEANDESEPYWSGDLTLVHPTQRAVSVDNVFVNAAILLSPEAYPALFSITDEKTLPLRYSWRYYVDPDRLARGRLADILVDLRRLETAFPASAVGGAQATTLRSGLLGFMVSQQARWASAQAVLAVVAVGPAIVATAALALLAVLASKRRRETLDLSRNRGASPLQAVGSVVAEGLLLTIPVAILAGLLAVVLVAGGPDPAAFAIPLLVAGVATILLLAVVAPTALGPPGPAGRSAARGRRSSPRRLVAEAFVILVAVLGAWLLRERGVTGAGAASPIGVDPFIAAVPALVGVAVGLITLRLLPIPLGALSRLATTRRDLVPVLAMRRATRGASTAPVLLVLLATATVGAFSLATLVHLDRAGEAVAWQKVGASFRLSQATNPLPRDAQPGDWPGVETAVPAFQTTVDGGNSRRMELLALDLAAYGDVVAGTPAATSVPDPAILAVAPASDGSGTAGSGASEGIPAIVSATPLGTDPLRVGDAFDLTVDGRPTTFRVAAVQASFPTLEVGSPFLVVDRAALQASRVDEPLRTTSWLIRAPDEGADGFAAEAERAAPGATFESRAAVTTAIREAPVIGAVSTGVAAAGLVAAIYAALALAAALALSGAARANEDAHLRTLGMGTREGIALVVIEHGPTILIAFGVGVVLGLGLFLALRPGLGLAAVVGSALEVPLSVAAGQLVLLLGAVLAVAAVGMAIGVVLERGTVAAGAIRRGIE